MSSLTGLNWVSTFFSSKMLFAQHYALRTPTSNIQHPPSAFQHPPSAIQHPTSAIQHPPSNIRHSTSAIQHPPSTIQHPPSITRHPPSAIHHPPSTTRHPTSTIQHFSLFFSKNTKMQACSGDFIRIRCCESLYRLQQGQIRIKKTSLNFRAGWLITVILPGY